MGRIAREDVLDSLIPERPMTAWDVARMLALRGCVEDDGRDEEGKVRRHLAALEKGGAIDRAAPAADGAACWLRPPLQARARRRVA